MGVDEVLDLGEVLCVVTAPFVFEEVADSAKPNTSVFFRRLAGWKAHTADFC